MSSITLTHCKQEAQRQPYQPARSYYEVREGDTLYGQVEHTKGRGWVILPSLPLALPTLLHAGQYLQYPGSKAHYYESKEAAVERLVTWAKQTPEERQADYDYRRRRAEVETLRGRVNRAHETYTAMETSFKDAYRPQVRDALEQAMVLSKTMFVTLWNAWVAAIPEEDRHLEEYARMLTMARAELLGIDFAAELKRIKAARS